MLSTAAASRNLLTWLTLLIAFFILAWITFERKRACSGCLPVSEKEMRNHDHIDDGADSLSNAVSPSKSKDLSNRTCIENEEWESNWDARDNLKGVDKTLGARTIIMVRHGQYHMLNGSLTERGWQQANETAMRLKRMGFHISYLVNSNMIRAQQTADVIARHFPNVPRQQDPMLQEGGPIPPHPTITYWSLPEKNYHEDGPRIEGAFRKYFHRAEPGAATSYVDLIVGHANVIRFFILRVLQFPRNAWMRLFIAHGSISLVSINADGTVSLHMLGDSGHMPTDLVTY